MIFETHKKSFLNSRHLLYIGYIGFLVSVLAGRISEGVWFQDLVVNSSMSLRIFDFLSGFGTGLAIITILASLLLNRFCENT